MPTATNEAARVPGDPGYLQLVTRIRAGDTSAMEEVYEDQLPRLRRLIFHSLGPQDTNDAVNDTFCAAFRLIQSGAVREPERLPGYMWGIARIQILGYIQSRVPRRELESGLGLANYLADRQPNPEQASQVSEARAVAREALLGLRERHREVLLRFYLEHQNVRRNLPPDEPDGYAVPTDQEPRQKGVRPPGATNSGGQTAASRDPACPFPASGVADVFREHLGEYARYVGASLRLRGERAD